MGARVVTGKSLCKGPKVGAALRGKEGQRLGRLGRRELGGWNLMAQVGRVGARPSPQGFGIHWGEGVREPRVTVTACLPQPWHCQSPGRPQGHGERPSCRGDGGASCEVRGGSQSGRHVKGTRPPGSGGRGVSGRSSLSKSVDVGRYRRNVRHGQ